MYTIDHVKRVARRARDVLSDPTNWTTGTYARNGRGRATIWNSEDAVCWCATGALWRAAWDLQLPVTVADRIIDGIKETHRLSLVEANDREGREFVLELIGEYT